MQDKSTSYKYYLFYGNSYGIECKNHSGESVKVIHDITVSKDKAENLVLLLNRHEVSPVHFEDIVEDELI